MSVGLLNLIEVIINGLMVGVLYSLVALGFVLIFKASGIFNFAQGVMALFAALTLVGLQEGLMPISYAATESAVDEERRLLYVGITRARRRLHLSWSKSGGQRGATNAPSRFLKELRLPELPKR